MEKFNDTDIRSALHKIEQKREPIEVPDDFLDNVLSAIDESQPKTINLWRYVAVAASVVLIVGIGMLIMNDIHAASTDDIVLSENLATDTIKNNNTTPEVVAAVEETKPVEIKTEQPEVSPKKEAIKVPSEPKTTPIIKKQTPPAEDHNDIEDSQTMVADADLDTATAPLPNIKRNLSPSYMDEYVTKMAQNRGADQTTLDCDPDKDSSIVEMMYVFKRNDDEDIMGRLIMSAVKYDESAKGFFLNFSQEKFFFSLSDEKTGSVYLWIAEKTNNGQVVLYTSHTPNGVENNTDCYSRYHNKLIYNNMNSKHNY